MDAAVRRVLSRAQGRRFLGPLALSTQLDHAEGFAAIVAGRALPGQRWLDLGSGAGLPGLVCALALPDTHWTLLDGATSRTEFLGRAVQELGLGLRVEVLAQRAEDAGRVAARRASFDGITARSFGSPAVTAECAAPLLGVGGCLLVSEPPTDTHRWPADKLRVLGLEPRTRHAIPVAVMELEQVRVCPATFPRRVGIPRKRPLF